jgi:hypothetical protein
MSRPAGRRPDGRDDGLHPCEALRLASIGISADIRLILLAASALERIPEALASES